MNAKQALSWMENDTGIMSCNDDAWPIAIRALRLLAAAEANDGSTPETDALIDSAYPSAKWVVASGLCKCLERERTGLAARVAELEPDAERLDWCQANHFAPRATLITTSGDTSPKVWINDQPRLGYMGRSLREAIDAARSK